MFKTALANGNAENYFTLVGNFATQHDPSSCGPAALSMILNSLSIDPKKPWKGVWRWWSDSTLSCLSPLEELDGRGITFAGFERLATCNGLHVVSKRGDHHSYDEFVRDVKYVCQDPGNIQMVVSFSRKALGQTGDGHFSPVAGFVDSWEGSPEPYGLVLDVARFKYPSFWVSLRELYDATTQIDRETGLARGWYLMRKADDVEVAQDAFAAEAISRRRRNTSVCGVGERKVNESTNDAATAKIATTIKDAGLDTLISKVIPGTLKEMYPTVISAFGPIEPKPSEIAASAPEPTIENITQLVLSLIFDHAHGLSTSLAEQFLPTITVELTEELQSHPLFSLIASTPLPKDLDPSLWTREKLTALFLALPPACFKPFILSRYPKVYDMMENARKVESEELKRMVAEWRVEWEKKTQQNCDCHHK